MGREEAADFRSSQGDQSNGLQRVWCPPPLLDMSCVRGWVECSVLQGRLETWHLLTQFREGQGCVSPGCFSSTQDPQALAEFAGSPAGRRTQSRRVGGLRWVGAAQ